jgi:hypothetical protein
VDASFRWHDDMGWMTLDEAGLFDGGFYKTLE